MRALTAIEDVGNRIGRSILVVYAASVMGAVFYFSIGKRLQNALAGQKLKLLDGDFWAFVEMLSIRQEHHSYFVEVADFCGGGHGEIEGLCDRRGVD